LNTLVNLLTELAQKQGFNKLDPWPHIMRAVEQVSKTDLRVNLAFFAGACGDRGEIANVQESNLTIGISSEQRLRTWPTTITHAPCGFRPSGRGAGWPFRAGWLKKLSLCGASSAIDSETNIESRLHRKTR